MLDRTFITGATGVVGSHLLSALIAQSDDVVALVRTNSAVRKVRTAGATGVVGNVTKPYDLADAMWGCETVFHVAGVNEGCPRRAARMDAVNIEGAVNVVEAAASAGVKRVVLTSSVAAIGEESGTIGTEQTIHSGSYVSAYARSKHLGEQAAMQAAVDKDIDLVVVNPASVQGPGRATGSAELLLRAMRSKRPWLVDVTVSIIDTEDCTNGHILAATNGKAGERYILSGATISVAEIVEILSGLADAPIRPRWLSEGVVRSLGMPLSRFAASVGRSKSICPDLVRSLLHGHRYDNSKSKSDLGLEYTPIEDTFAKTIAWFHAEGLIG
ncbi:MAG: NAD-dependent epimerase/dehydratase family protein [Actinomycetota bacterium]|nr:NAD-dependent epimerase/dehydratase family protein [Actinomycetota bacterium]